MEFRFIKLSFSVNLQDCVDLVLATNGGNGVFTLTFLHCCFYSDDL